MVTSTKVCSSEKKTYICVLCDKDPTWFLGKIAVLYRLVNGVCPEEASYF